MTFEREFLDRLLSDQDVQVEQSNVHASSSIFLTSSRVIGCAVEETEKTGKLPLLRVRAEDLMPLRASSEITVPTGTDRVRARLLAATSKSSSIVIVVRISVQS